MNDLIGLLKELGISKIIIYSLTILGILFGLISLIVKFIYWAILKNNQWLLNENLHPYFSTNDVDRATRYYIPTKYQNVSPMADDEPGKSHIASAKELLMPMFLNRAFKNNSDNTKYYLILADAGMGKTTFLTNLFLSYTSKPLRNLFGWGENQKIKLFPLGSPDIWTDIEKIEDKRNTILLLDAFDEDIKAVDNYDARMKEILETTKEFKEIVITCRTQFFPSDKEIPDDTGYTTFGGEQETYKFQRVYLSVFDETDIKKYLKQRFSFFQFSKRKKAFKIVKKSPNLVMRPMLLSYINDFVEASRTYKYSYEIYEVLIDKWIERESKKHGIRKKYGGEEKYREMLLNFSQSLAVNLYEKSGERGGYFITKDDFIKDANGLQITDVDNYGMTETEVRSKSLLNRNAEGKYKFSHKSILEYFLAKELIQNGKFLYTFDFEGMNAAEMFLDEMIELEYAGYNQAYGSASAFSKELSGITDLIVLVMDDFNSFMSFDFSRLKRLVIFDSEKYKLLYDLYFFVLYQQELAKQYEEPLERLKRLKLQETWKHLKCITLREILVFTEVSIFLKKVLLKKEKKFLYQKDRKKLLDPNLMEQLHWFEWRERLIELFNKNDDELQRTLQPIEEFLILMKVLQEKLPNCKMIY